MDGHSITAKHVWRPCCCIRWARLPNQSTCSVGMETYRNNMKHQSRDHIKSQKTLPSLRTFGRVQTLVVVCCNTKGAISTPKYTSHIVIIMLYNTCKKTSFEGGIVESTEPIIAYLLQWLVIFAELLTVVLPRWMFRGNCLITGAVSSSFEQPRPRGATRWHEFGTLASACDNYSVLLPR